MTVIFGSGDIFLAEEDCIAHGCNCEGIMGAGLAKQVKKHYPESFKEYRDRCLDGNFTPGGLFFDKRFDKPLLHMATQETIKEGAKIEYIEQCLKKLMVFYRTYEISSVALPKIGAGLGGLFWEDVKGKIVKLFLEHSLEIHVYERYQRGKKFSSY